MRMFPAANQPYDDQPICLFYCTVIFAAMLAAVPTVTTTGCTPGATPGGMTQLICVTPTSPLGIPINASVAGTPPTVTVTGNCGLGSRASGVVAEGVEPVESDGVTCPSPVTNRVTVCPRAPLREGLTLPSPKVKIPGPAAATLN